jgi:hypothetical protein
MYKILLIALFGFVIIHPTYSQDDEINVAGLVFLDYRGYLPETIRSGKTIVLVNTTKVLAEQTFNKTAEPLIEQAHEVFIKAGIDVVGYYSLKQVFAGKDSQYGFSEAWKKREIKNILVISRVVFQKKKKEVTRYVLLASTFNGKPSLFSNGQIGWKSQGKDFDKVLARIASAANKYDRKNLLVNDSPEYFDDVKMVWGEHVEGYLTDLDFGKLAVPRFETVTIPSPKPSGAINNLVAKQVEESNTLNLNNNRVLEEKMKGYDYEYELVDPNISIKKLSETGYSYVLLRLYSPGIDIKKLLNYDINEDQDTYSTQIYTNSKLTIRRIPANGLVHKYYIKHLRTGNIYLGPKWDADETWGEALDHMLYNIKVEMKR